MSDDGIEYAEVIEEVAIYQNKTITMYDDDTCGISWVSKHYKDL